MRNVISVDVEDYFHPAEIQPYVRERDWSALPSRVERATGLLLETMARRSVRGTFFILGWVAEKFPALVREIHAAGHELGCHSSRHRLVYDLTPEQFHADTSRAVDAIGAACGVRVRAYRAPSYSITGRSLWALGILAGLGFTHDSSIYPIHHDRYGIPGANRHAHLVDTGQGPILEAPVATAQISLRQVLPVGGGAYLRLLPYRYTAAGLRRINGIERQPAVVYLHPWEVDPGQPRLATGLLARLRTYRGLDGMLAKFDRLLGEFSFAPLGEVHPAP
jgi:polysaccharide deacetylase family protein (PEP-CTERM system associated)